MLALFAAVSLYAADLNIYASGLKAEQQGSTVTAYYTLNTQADSLYFMLFGDNIDAAMIMKVDEATALTKGAHALPLTLPTEVPSGVYHWAIKAFSSATTFADALNGDGMYNFYLPQDVAVDVNCNSPFFGRVYVSESTDGASDGGSAATKAQTRGLYMYNADMTFVNGDTAALNGYDGGIGGARNGRAGFKRIAIDNNGLVYVASRDAATQGVWRIDPANPTANAVQVLAASAAVDAIGIVGNDMYTLEGIGLVDGACVGSMKEYSLATIPVGAPTGVMGQDTILGFGNSDVDAAYDGRGGWWFTEHRYSVDAYPCLKHVGQNGVDYIVDNAHNTDLLSNADGGASYRGVIAINPDGNLLAMGSNKRAVVFSIAYDATSGVPTLTKLCETAILGGNIDGVAFDVANNLYVASASSERLYAFPIATTDNSCVVPAPDKSKVYIGVPVPVQHMYLMGDNTGWNPTQGIELTCTADSVFEGVFTFTNDTSYFAFFDALAENNDQGGWDYVNAHRYAGETDNVLLNAAYTQVAAEKANRTFRVAPAGQYKLRINLKTSKVAMFYQAPAAIDDNAIYIAFKDVPGKEGGDNSNAVTSIEDIIKAGADYIDTIPTATKIYNSREGCGVKFGNSSVVGELTLRLANAVIPDAIIVNAIAYGGNNNEGVAVLMGDTVNLKQYGNKVLHPYTKQYDGQTVVSELTFSSTASNRIYLLDVIIIPAAQDTTPIQPTVYKIKHPWDLNNVDPWIWKECEEQIDGTWALEAPYYGGGCNIDPKVLEQDWIASPVLVGNPYNGDSCRFVINPAATDVAGILTITKLGDPNPDTTVVVYDHLYEIGDNQGWKPTEAIEMTKKSENVFEGTFDFTATLSYFAFITVKPETEDWTLVNANRFGGAINNELIADGGTYNLNAGELCLTANPGKYTITVNLTEKTAAVTLETGIENINGENNVQKVLRNGQIYIIRDGETYTVTGAKVE